MGFPAGKLDLCGSARPGSLGGLLLPANLRDPQSTNALLSQGLSLEAGARLSMAHTLSLRASR